MKFILSLLLISHLWSLDYDLHTTRLPGTSEKTTLCLHGMGGDYRIAEYLKRISPLKDTLVSFNFPDHNFVSGKRNPHATYFGTIHELLPAISLLKRLIIEEKRPSLNLYGFSAGGGAIINILAILNTVRYDKELKEIGIQQEEKKKILEALQKGLIILDVPLKSVAEIIDFRGKQEDLVVIGKRFQQNDLEPIDSIKHLKGLKLDIVVHFQAPDEVLSNRDDLLFIERLKCVNRMGRTDAIIGSDGGHMAPHLSLWNFLK